MSALLCYHIISHEANYYYVRFQIDEAGDKVLLSDNYQANLKEDK